jgi:predicted small secreted protein
MLSASVFLHGLLADWWSGTCNTKHDPAASRSCKQLGGHWEGIKLKTINIMLLLCLLSMTVCACNAAPGLAKDLKAAGSSRDEEADEHFDD